MKRNPARLQIICGAGAQLSWIYAWASFLLFSFFQRIYPLPEVLGIFSLAALLTFFCRRHRWRPIQLIAIHLAGIAGGGLRVVYVFYYRLEPWWSTAWLVDFFNRPRNQLEWFLLIFVLGFTVFFWLSGLQFAREARSYTRACSRFDRGMIAFFCIFLVKLTFQTRMGVEFRDTITLMMIFPFFIFSLTEIGLARSQGAGQPKEFLKGYYAIGVMASFACGTLIIGAGIIMFFLPYLKAVSVAGYDILQSAAGPLGAVFTAAIRFIFGHAGWQQTAADITLQSDTASPVGSSPWMLQVQKILMWGGLTLLIAMGAVIACVLLWYALRWLFMQRGAAEPIGDPWRLRWWWMRLTSWVYTFFRWMRRSGQKRTALQFYAALLRWGRYSGFSQNPDETPGEYGRRLSRRFPQLKAEITLIVEMLHWEVYGETTLHPKKIDEIRRAWQKLHSPLRWPFRIKSIMTNS